MRVLTYFSRRILLLFLVLGLFLNSVSCADDDDDESEADEELQEELKEALEELQEAFDECELGKVFNETEVTCTQCTVTVSSANGLESPFENVTETELVEDDGCYEHSYCVRDSGVPKCTCESPLTLINNTDKACGMCTKDEDCFEESNCFNTVNHGSVCMMNCTHDENCTSNDPRSECRIPYWMATAERAQKMCMCNETFEFVKGFGCREKQNLTESALECYKCHHDNCEKPPYDDVVTCDVGSVCFIKAFFNDWEPIRYDVMDHVQFNPFTVKYERGCWKSDNDTVERNEALLENKTEWQGCKIIRGHDDKSKDYIRCYNTCDTRFCNWQILDPIVNPKSLMDEEDDDVFFFWWWLLLLLLLLLLLCCCYQKVKKKKSEGEDAPLDGGGDKGDDYGSTGAANGGAEDAGNGDDGGNAGNGDNGGNGTKQVTEQKDVTIKAQSRINTGITKKAPSEVKLGTTTTTKTVPE